MTELPGKGFAMLYLDVHLGLFFLHTEETYRPGGALSVQRWADLGEGQYGQRVAVPLPFLIWSFLVSVVVVVRGALASPSCSEVFALWCLVYG